MLELRISPTGLQGSGAIEPSFFSQPPPPNSPLSNLRQCDGGLTFSGGSTANWVMGTGKDLGLETRLGYK